MVNEQRLVELFKQLCLINAPSKGERQCTDFVKQLLEAEGLTVVEDGAGEKIGGNSGNLIAWVPGTIPEAPKIFLSAHLDTVEPTAGLTIVEKDGVLYSDGTTILGADDKGGLAPIIETVRILKENNLPHGDICLIISVAEEIGLMGAKEVALEDLNLDFGFVLDTGPPVGSFVNRTATHDKFNVAIIGKPAHSGKDPEKGINAIQVLSDAVVNMKLGRIGPETTANLGVIEGGSAVNVVCAEVKIKGEARSTNVAELDEQIGHMIHCFEQAATKWGATVKIDHDRHYGSYHIPEDHPIIGLAKAAALAEGFTPTLRTNLGGSDANVYNTRGVPTIVVATGMDKIHTHEENISIRDLCDTTRLSVRLVLEASRVRQWS